MKINNIIKYTIFVITLGIVLIGVTIEATIPLPPSPQNEIESMQLLNNMTEKVAKSEQLFSQAKSVNLKGKGLFNRFFIKRIIRKMNKEFNLAKNELKEAGQAHLIKNYDAVNSLHVSIIGKTSYINVYLEKIIAGKRKSDWNRSDVVDVVISN